MSVLQSAVLSSWLAVLWGMVFAKALTFVLNRYPEILHWILL